MSVERYLSEYRNIILMVVDVSEGEKIDLFTNRLKYKVKIEVLKSSSDSFEECSRIDLNMDSAIWRVNRGNFGYQSGTSESGPTPMKIGNVNGVMSNALTGQRKRDLEKGACFKFHKVGGRPWKCSTPRSNKFDVTNEASSEQGNTVLLSD